MSDSIGLVSFIGLFASVVVIGMSVFLVVVVHEGQRTVREHTRVLHEMVVTLQRINTRVEVIDAKVTTNPNG